MAATLRSELGVQVDLVVGGPGEFTVWVGGDKVAGKGWLLFPSRTKVLEAVGARLRLSRGSACGT